METCWPCKRNQHAGCVAIISSNTCECTHENIVQPVVKTESLIDLTDEPVKATRRNKDDSSVTDPQSTGRKRAAALYPLTDANGNKLPCDFQNKKNCLPSYMEEQIDGCGVRNGTMPNFAQARHHHDYNVLNNDRTNVALLCSSCHNLLHARNDPFKDKIYERIYGVKPSMDDLKHANKALKSGVVDGGTVLPKNVKD